jgi:hypothetical protein
VAGPIYRLTPARAMHLGPEIAIAAQQVGPLAATARPPVTDSAGTAHCANTSGRRHLSDLGCRAGAFAVGQRADTGGLCPRCGRNLGYDGGDGWPDRRVRRGGGPAGARGPRSVWRWGAAHGAGRHGLDHAVDPSRGQLRCRAFMPACRMPECRKTTPFMLCATAWPGGCPQHWGPLPRWRWRWRWMRGGGSGRRCWMAGGGAPERFRRSGRGAGPAHAVANRANLRALFIATARDGLTQETAHNAPLSGHAFALRKGVPGWPELTATSGLG